MRPLFLTDHHARTRMICGAAVVLLLGFIWGNSLQPADKSGELSGSILTLLHQLWGMISESAFPLSHTLLRKLAHFSEFMLLGVLAALTATLGRAKMRPYLPGLLYGGLLAALADETIQYFSPGRAPQVTDVLIDHAGFCCGLLVIMLLRAIFQGLTR